MKKVLVFVTALTLVAGSVFAQKGTWYVGTNAMTSAAHLGNPGTSFTTGFFTTKEGDAKNMCVGIAPDGGYFFADKWSVGLSLAYNYFSFKENSDADAIKTNAFGINPYVRYFAYSAGNFAFYLQGGLSYVSSKEDIDGVDAINTLYAGINPGISYSFGDHFGVTASFGNLGYTSYGEDTNRFDLNLNMSTLKFGLSYKF